MAVRISIPAVQQKIKTKQTESSQQRSGDQDETVRSQVPQSIRKNRTRLLADVLADYICQLVSILQHQKPVSMWLSLA